MMAYGFATCEEIASVWVDDRIDKNAPSDVRGVAPVPDDYGWRANDITSRQC